MVKPEELSDEEQAERKAFARRFLGASIEDSENQIREATERRELAMKAWEETFGEPWPADAAGELPLPELRAGIYRHYKGPHYLVLGYANDANDEGRVVVVYVGLQLDGAKKPIRMHVRTVEDFFAMVPMDIEVGDGSTEPGLVERFTYIGPEMQLEDNG